MIVSATLALAVACFVLDLLMPLGTGLWGLYLLPVLLCYKAGGRHYPLYFAGLCTVLIAIGHCCSPPGAMNPRLSVANRCLGVSVIWITSVLQMRRREAQDRLRESEQRARAIFDHSPFAIFIKDLSGKYIEFNRHCEIYNGISRKDAVGQSDRELFGDAFAELSAITHNQVLETGKAVTYERQVPNKKGAMTHLVVKFPLHDESGKCNAICGIAADITNLKEAELALRQNQERLDLAQTAGRIGIFDWVLATNKVIWSPALESLYGLQGGTFGGTYDDWLQRIHPDDRERADSDTRRAFPGRRELDHEFRIVWPDGSVRWIRSVARVFCNDSGEALRALGINVDITESRRVQQALAISRDRLELIARITAIVVSTSSFEEQAGILAEHVRKAFGVDFCIIRTLEDTDLVLLAAAGIPTSSLQRRLPAQLGVAPEVLAKQFPIFVKDVHANPITEACMLMLPEADRYKSYVSAPLLAQERILGMMGIYSKAGLAEFSDTDLEHLQIVAHQVGVAIANDRLFKDTSQRQHELARQIADRKLAERDLKQSEERFRAISEQTLAGIYITQDEKVSYVNPAFAEIFGYTTAELLALPSILDLVAEEDRAEAAENLRGRSDNGLQGRRFHFHGRRRDGSIVRVETYGARTDLDGRPAIIGMLHDVTEREQSEAVLKRTTEQLQTLSRRLLELQETERRHIARELHDEIGQALTALKINLQAVQRLSGESAFAPRLLDSIAIVDRTLRQVRDLSLNLRPSLLDDLGLFAALRWFADQQAQRSGLRIRFVAAEMETRLEPALETACFRVAQEALTNIVRHARASNVMMELSVKGNSLHLVVSDDGVGFDFGRLRAQANRGPSLGLLGMEERASLIGGRIRLVSAPGQGTEVHASFPLSQIESKEPVDDNLALK